MAVFHPFEKKVLSALIECGLDPASVSKEEPLGAAVSGGADSVSLLLSLRAIFPNDSLRVISVDHGIRPKEESGGDADFARDLCGQLSVPFFVERIESGEIEGAARREGLSVEALARKARYEIFDSFIERESLSFLCLAHNRNDQVETLLMRFLQGGGSEGMGGIKSRRGKYLRPLLGVSRLEIESYLRDRNQRWRSDSSNSDTRYLRNKIRRVLVPFLDENFSGWQGAVLAGARKSRSDDDFIKSSLRSEKKFPAARIERGYFYGLHDALKRRVFFSALNGCGVGERFPFQAFERIVSWENEDSQEMLVGSVRISLDSESLSINPLDDGIPGKRRIVGEGFSFLLKNPGDEIRVGGLFVRAEMRASVGDAAGGGALSVVVEEKSSSAEAVSFLARLPFLARSVLPGDRVETARGNFKSVSEILNDWKIFPGTREKVLVFEELPCYEEGGGRIRAVIASFAGSKNWIVEEAKL